MLKEEDGRSVLASLPTRRNSIPVKDSVADGCVELPEINLNCFVISPNTAITEDGYCFPDASCPTHIYGHQIDFHDTNMMRSVYPHENVDYEVYGKMDDAIFNDLINCLKNSKSVKNKFKKIL
ncbi:MAG: hypothetical protein AB8B56_07885 [Crocinitomicaceae bacterium]